MACVYALSSSLDPTVRYVGRSKEADGSARLKRHLAEARGGIRSHKNNWVRSVHASGGEIVSTVLESGISFAESGVREIFYIAHYSGLSVALTNLTVGGDGALGAIRSAETRAKISIAQVGRTRSVETRAKISAALSARVTKPRSAEYCAKMSVAHKGRTKSLEHRAKIGDALRGRTLSAEHRAKMSAASTVRWAREKESKTSNRKKE